MLLTFGPTAKLNGKPWHVIEIASEATAEATLNRLGRSLPNLFRNHAVQVLIPISHRDLNCFQLETGSYLYVRSTSFTPIWNLQKVLGVGWILTEGESHRPADAITIEDSHVQAIIQRLEDEFHSRADQIRPGSFVRVLAGETRDYCGTVEAVTGNRATVVIELNTRQIRLTTPTTNLLNLDHVPKSQRVFWYSPDLTEK